MNSTGKFLWRGVKLITLLIVVAIVCLGAWLGAYLLYTRTEMYRRIDCNNNLKQIGCSLHIYASDHGGRFPESLSELAPQYLGEPQLLICPSTGSKPGPMSAVHSWTSYIYVSGLTESDRSDIPQILEDPKNHSGAGGNVCFVGGYVKWMNTADLLPLLRAPWGGHAPPHSDAAAVELKQRVRIIYPGQKEPGTEGDGLKSVAQ